MCESGSCRDRSPGRCRADRERDELSQERLGVRQCNETELPLCGGCEDENEEDRPLLCDILGQQRVRDASVCG
jgi:hypothetical protein